jgi:hypothetical protein
LHILLLLALLKPSFIYTILFAFALLLLQSASAQYKVKGTVYDSTYMKPLSAVSVLTTSGKGTSTNEKGQYEISVSEKDSIWFSFLGKPTIKYSILKIYDVTRFDIALQTYNQLLDEVTIRKRSYRLDSLQNRKDYANIFDFRKPNLETMTSIGPMGAGIDINELIRLFQFKKNKSTLKFQERLVTQEKEKYVDHKFNRGLVRQLTGLDGEELERFMNIYRPPYEMIIMLSDYDFQFFIRKSFEEFSNRKAF